MNEKLIRRAAVMYRNWLISQTQVSVTNPYWKKYILDAIDKANDKAVQMRIWTEQFFRGSTQRIQLSEWSDEPHRGIVCPSVYEKIATNMIPELGDSVIASTKHAAAMLKSLITQKVITVISPKEAIDEIRVIVNAWPKVKFKGGVLSVLIKNVTLEDDNKEVNLGSFWINVSLRSPLDNLRIDSVDNIESQDGYLHPHVSGNELCIGAGGFPSQEALCQGRLEDYFRVVEAVMRTYNEASPHEPLSKWYGQDHEGEFFCELCDEWRSDDSSYWCERCETDYCEYCGASGGCCKECGKWRCSECSTSCWGCNETVCNDCILPCSKCGNTMCSSCLESCNVCGAVFCESCVESCAYCGDRMCDDCTATCRCCDKNCCTSCVDKTCHECGKNICKDCQMTCNECDKIVCSDCNNNSCEHCGVSMCSTCECEHNCLLEGVESSTQSSQ